MPHLIYLQQAAREIKGRFGWDVSKTDSGSRSEMIVVVYRDVGLLFSALETRVKKVRYPRGGRRIHIREHGNHVS